MWHECALSARASPELGRQQPQRPLFTDLRHDHVRFAPVSVVKIRDKCPVNGEAGAAADERGGRAGLLARPAVSEPGPR